MTFSAALVFSLDMTTLLPVIRMKAIYPSFIEGGGT
jgi:hypothetical protein